MPRQRRAPVYVAKVTVNGPDPAGTHQAYALLDAYNRGLAGDTAPTPAGWGIAGSTPVTDFGYHASPQAFNGTAGLVAHATMTPGGGSPVIYDAETNYDFDTVYLPDQVTVGS